MKRLSERDLFANDVILMYCIYTKYPFSPFFLPKFYAKNIQIKIFRTVITRYRIDEITNIKRGL